MKNIKIITAKELINVTGGGCFCSCQVKSDSSIKGSIGETSSYGECAIACDNNACSDRGPYDLLKYHGTVEPICISEDRCYSSGSALWL